MLVNAVYKKFRLPPNLIRHMAEVATVSQFLMDHWIGSETFNSQLVIETALASLSKQHWQ